MKVQIKIAPNTIVEASGETLQEVFEQIARMEEIFGVNVCGLCGGKQIKHVLREVDNFRFFELHCQAKQCRARLAFGQLKSVKGSLFPRRKDDKGQWLANGGWVKYQPQENGKDHVMQEG